MQTEITVCILWFWKNIFKSDTFKTNLFSFPFVLFIYFFLILHLRFFLVRVGVLYCLCFCLFLFFYYSFCHVSNVVWKRIYYMSNYYIRIFQTSLIWPRNSDQDNLFNATVFSFAKETFTITRKPDWLHCAKNNI